MAHDHQHAHVHGHGHGAARDVDRHRGRLAIAFGVIAGFFVVQVIGAVWTNSLALLSDAGHMLTDVIGLGMALAAISLASRFASRQHATRSSHTFGLYRLEILAAFVNALLLFGVALWVVIEAIGRISDPPEVLAGPMLAVAVIGLLANVFAYALLRGGSKESLNLEAASLEVLADTVGSLGVIVAALLLHQFGWTWIDPLVGAAVGLWILPRTWRLGRQAVRILLQAAPADVDLDQLAEDLTAIDGVEGVHDLHVWTLTSQMDAASAHLVTATGADNHSILDQARHCVSETYGVAHGTFQLEPAHHQGCDRVTW